MKIKITGITEWIEDDHLIAGDASHEGDRAIQRLVEAERVNKIDEGMAEGLPFVCEAENEDEALEQYNKTHCEYDYLKAFECDWDEVGYSLAELLALSTDAWVNAMSNLADAYGDKVDGFKDTDCPAEYESEFNAVAERHGVTFGKDGNII